MSLLIGFGLSTLCFCFHSSLFSMGEKILDVNLQIFSKTYAIGGEPFLIAFDLLSLLVITFWMLNLGKIEYGRVTKDDWQRF